MDIYIGTSGFSYGSWKGTFYPHDLSTKKWFEYYSQHYNTVEINSSFYRSLRAQTYDNWFKNSPDDFIFAIKAHRYITQLKKLKDIDEQVQYFFESVMALRHKLGVILWQFPKSFVLSPEHEQEYLERLVHLFEIVPTTVRHAFEFRDISWFVNEKVIRLFKTNNASVVISSSSQFPEREVLTADFVYIRFHGPEGLYSSSYSENQLREWVERINIVRKERDVYAYFNNDVSGYAIDNSNLLKDLLEIS